MFWLDDRNRPQGEGGFSSTGTWEIFTLCMRSAPSAKRVCQYVNLAWSQALCKRAIQYLFFLAGLILPVRR
jgi:hypothetical protein